MGKTDTFRLNRKFLLHRLEVLGLTQQTLAYALKVHRQTIGRWVNGHILEINRVNAYRLAETLQVSVDDLIEREQEQEPLKDVRSIAKEKDLIEVVRHTENFDLAENLLKATLSDELETKDKIRIYNHLTFCCVQQNKLDEAHSYLEKSLACFEKLENSLFRASTVYMQALYEMHSFHYVDALEKMNDVLSHVHDLDNERQQAMAYMTRATLHVIFLNEHQAKRDLMCAIEKADQLEDSYLLTAFYKMLGNLYVVCGQLDQAQKAYETAEKHAPGSSPRHRIALTCRLVDVYLLQKRDDKVDQFIDQVKKTLSAYGHVTPFSFLTIARYMRVKGDLDEAQVYLDQVESIFTQEASHFTGLYLQEKARLLKAQGKFQEAQEVWQKSRDLFFDLKLDKRAIVKEVTEYPAVDQVACQ